MSGEIPAGTAKEHVHELQETLRGDDFCGPEWDMHRQLLRAAYNTTNGGAGDLRVLSENLGMLTATYVQDRVRLQDNMKQAFAEFHGDICLFNKQITIDADGKKIMPWDRKTKEPWYGSFLTLEAGSKKMKAGGIVAVILSIGLILLGFRWLGASVSTGIVKTVNNAVKAQVAAQVDAALALQKEGNDE